MIGRLLHLPPAGIHLDLRRAGQLGWSLQRWSEWERQQDALDLRRAEVRDTRLSMAVGLFAIATLILGWSMGDVHSALAALR